MKVAALVRSLILVAVMAVALFGSAGRFDIVEFWIYLAIMAAATAFGLGFIDPELARERMRPGGASLPTRLLLTPLPILIHLCIAGLDRGRLHWTNTVPVVLRFLALAIFAACWAVVIWAMHVNRFFSSVARIQSERDHHVITAGPYAWVRHPGYGASVVAALVSGIALGSWLAALVGALMVPLILWRASYEDQLLREQLSGYRDYAARVRYRFLPGVW
jgi:protein-S-isoprenylcysteine O-methyltransferase Ste14